METFTIKVRNGLIYSGDEILDVVVADRIARANMDEWNVAEHFVKAFDGKTMKLDSVTFKEVLE